MTNKPLTKRERMAAVSIYRNAQLIAENGPAKDTDFCKKLVGILEVLCCELEAQDYDRDRAWNTIQAMHEHISTYLVNQAQ